MKTTEQIIKDSYKWNINLKIGIIYNEFVITPLLQVSWSEKNKKDFAIELIWLRFGIGIRFRKGLSIQIE